MDERIQMRFNYISGKRFYQECETSSEVHFLALEVSSPSPDLFVPFPEPFALPPLDELVP